MANDPLLDNLAASVRQSNKMGPTIWVLVNSHSVKGTLISPDEFAKQAANWGIKLDSVQVANEDYLHLYDAAGIKDGLQLVRIRIADIAVWGLAK